MENLLSINDCYVSYDDKVVLNNINLTVNNNDFIGIIGPNGGGKSTLIKLITGEVKPYKGSIDFSENIRNNIGYLPQYSAIDKSFPITVKEIVLSGLQSQKGIFKRYNKADKELVMSCLELCGIYSLSKRSVNQLSGGELQRTLLCRAIISQPKLLILDEPNNNVDNKFEKELYELLRRLNENMAIIMVSHDVGTITSYVKTIACVNKTLHYHNSNIITQQQLLKYDCPILLVAHGGVPHTVLEPHIHKCNNC